MIYFQENIVFPSTEEIDEKDGELSSSTEKTKDEVIKCSLNL